MYIAAIRRAMQQTALGPLYDALQAMDQLLSGGPSGPLTSPITVTYVASNGSDVTGTRGNITKPFLTIQAAINASLSGDVIDVAPSGPPGTLYNENLVVPAAFTELTLRGPALVSPATGVALTYHPTGVSGILNLDTITIETRDPGGPGGVNALDVSGTASAGAEVFVDGCTLGRGKFEDLVTASFYDTEIVGVPVFVNNEDISVVACIVEGLPGGEGGGAKPMAVTYDDTVAIRVRGLTSIKGSVLRGGLKLSGEPLVIADQATLIESPPGLFNFAIDATGLGITVNYGPDVTVQGSVFGPCQFTFAPTVGATKNVANFSGADFSDTVTVEVSAPDPSPARVKALNSIFRSIVTVGESTELEASNASILAALVGVGSGAANRPVSVASIALPGLMAAPVLIPLSPPMVDNFYQVVISSTDPATPVVFNTSKSTTDYGIFLETSLQTGAGSCDVSLVRKSPTP